MNPEMYAALQLIDSPQRNFARSALPDAPVRPDKHRTMSGVLRRVRAMTSARPRWQRYLLVHNANSPAGCS